MKQDLAEQTGYTADNEGRHIREPARKAEVQGCHIDIGSQGKDSAQGNMKNTCRVIDQGEGYAHEGEE